MNIKEISTVQVKDVPEDIHVTNIPTDEVCQEVVWGVIFSLIRRPRGANAHPVILKVASWWKRMRVSIPLDSNVMIIPPPHNALALANPIYLFPRSSCYFFTLKSGGYLIQSQVGPRSNPFLHYEWEREVDNEDYSLGKSTLAPAGLDVMETLKKLISSFFFFDMEGPTDLSF